MTSPTSLTLRLATCLALTSLCAVGLGACASPSQKVATSKEQGDSSTAVDENNSGTVGKVEADLRAEIAALKLKMESQQTTTQSGIFNFAKTTNSALLSGGSVMFAMLSIVHVVLYLGYRIVTRMIPLINADDHSALDITPDPGFGSPSLPGSQERKTGGASLSAQKSVSNV